MPSWIVESRSHLCLQICVKIMNKYLHFSYLFLLNSVGSSVWLIKILNILFLSHLVLQYLTEISHTILLGMDERNKPGFIVVAKSPEF